MLDRADDAVPTPREFYTLLQTLSLRVDRLEEENKKLKSLQKKKLHMLSWLNQTRRIPETTYEQWVQVLLRQVPAYLDVAFKESLFTAISQLLLAIDVAATNTLPICAYDNKSSQFYVYRTVDTDVAGWTLFTMTDVDALLKKIADRFYVDFVEVWYKENQPRLMNNDKLYDTFIHNQQKVSAIPNYTKLRQTLYLHIVQTIGSIIEYEFV
jgi:hypothetical protein